MENGEKEASQNFHFFYCRNDFPMRGDEQLVLRTVKYLVKKGKWLKMTSVSMQQKLQGESRWRIWEHVLYNHWRTTLYSTVLCYTILYYTILYYTILYYTILYYTILYYTILYYTILCYSTLYYTTLHYTTLHYTTLHRTFL